MAVRYKSLQSERGEGYRYESSLDRIFSPGCYSVEIDHTGIDVGLPINDCGEEHYIVGNLFVTDCGTMGPKQHNRVTGQVLVFTTRVEKATKIYTRTFADGEWGTWRSLTQTGMYDKIENNDELFASVEELVSITKGLQTDVEAEISRATVADNNNSQAISNETLRAQVSENILQYRAVNIEYTGTYTSGALKDALKLLRIETNNPDVNAVDFRVTRLAKKSDSLGTAFSLGTPDSSFSVKDDAILDGKVHSKEFTKKIDGAYYKYKIYFQIDFSNIADGKIVLSDTYENSKYIVLKEAVVYKGDVAKLETEIKTLTGGVFSFDFTDTYQYITLDFVIPSGCKVVNNGEITYSLYDKGQSESVKLTPGSEVVTGFDVMFIRSTTTAGTALLSLKGLMQGAIESAIENSEGRMQKAVELGNRVVEVYNANILNPEIWRLGSVMSNGNDNNDATTSARTDFIELPTEGRYIIQTKVYKPVDTTMTMYVAYYSSNKNSSFIRRDSFSIWSGKRGFTRIDAAAEGIKYVKIALTQYVGNYGVLPTADDVMVTASDAAEPVDYFVKYGDAIPYRLEGLKIDKEVEPLNNGLLSLMKSRFDGKILNVAYSSFGSGDDVAPVNTMEHFKFAVSEGFNAVKADMRLTKDNEIVLCHDKGFTLNEDGRIVQYDENNYVLIRDLTKDEVLDLTHEAYNASLGYYARPVALDEFLQLCKTNGVVPYITFRNEYVDETLPLLVKYLKKFRFENSCIVNIYPTDASLAGKVRDALPYVCICYTVGSSVELAESVIDTVYSLGNAVLCAHYDKLLGATDAAFDYAISKDIRVYGWGVATAETYRNLVNRGCSGFQLGRIKLWE